MREEREKRISDFMKRLDTLSTGERAVLKRSVGKMLREADARAVAAFYRCYPVSESEERWFAAACMHCLGNDEGKTAKPLQDILSDLRKEEALSDSMQNRLTGLLDLKWDRDGYLLTKLARMVKMVKAKGYVVDCGALLQDLLDWNNESQYVQRKWARSFYQGYQTKE